MWFARSIVISLAILLTIVDLTQGFTLRQRQQDLVAEESTNLEVKNDLRRSNDIQITEIDEPVAIVPILTKQDTTPVATDDTANTEAVKEPTERTYVTYERTLVDNVPTEAMEFATTTETTNNTIVVNTIGNYSLDWFETTMADETVKNEDIQTSTVTKNTVIETTSRNNVEYDKTVLAQEHSEIVTDTNPTTVTEQSTDTGITTTEFTDQSTEAQFPTSTPNEENDKVITETVTMKAEVTTAIDITTESQNTETSIPVTSFILSPVWKKYTSILRNRVDNTETEDIPPIAKFADSINAHTESRITLEKVFDLSPGIQSLQDLKNNLMESSNTVQTSRDLETTNTVETQTEVIPTTTMGLAENEEELTTASVEGNQTEMVSKRAGFLDHSKISTKEAAANTSRGREIELDGISYEIDLQDSDGIEHKKSHSRLAEDAIKEELLKESLINDKEVNSIRYRPTIKKEKESTSLDVATMKSVPDLLPVTEANVSEQKIVDELSVKPISPEKKNTNLYAVNPNYKPLKKIDVQPPKPFTRDPDDNSWRNESLTSLGIVFKANNASKAFTEVLKNKTETVMNNLPEVNKTLEKFELRDRLEKIAEKRKSKKKKVDKFGNTEYTDYEENNNSGDSHTSKETSIDTSPPLPTTRTGVSSIETTTMPVPVPSVLSLITNAHTGFSSTEKPKKLFNLQDYYDTTDDDDYATLPNVDIMKSTTRPRVQWPVTQRILDDTTPKQYLPERKPTVQYFPPLPKPSPDVSVNEYDDVFKKRLNLYNINTRKPTPPVDSTRPSLVRYTSSGHYPTENNFRNEKVSNENRNQAPIVQHVQYTSVDAGTTVYLTEPPKVSPAGSYEGPEGYSRGFIIRHYKDLLDAAIKDNDYDRNAYLFTDSPVTGVTANDAGKTTVKSEEDDYDQRKEVLDKFVDNFNQNHEQFKVDFPVLFNSSIVHKHGQEGGKVLASSSATFKRLYDATATKANGFLFSSKPFDPNCENITVELSPAYELHYYVPDQEEKEEQSKVTIPYGYRL